MSYTKTALPFDQYQRYQISQHYLAYQIVYTEVSLDRLEEVESELQSEGYKLFATETHANQDKFDVIFIVGKSNFTF